MVHDIQEASFRRGLGTASEIHEETSDGDAYHGVDHILEETHPDTGGHSTARLVGTDADGNRSPAPHPGVNLPLTHDEFCYDICVP